MKSTGKATEGPEAALAEAGSAEGHPADLVEDPEGDSEEEILEDLCKNMMPYALNAQKNASCLSGLQEESRFCAAIASGKAEMPQILQEERLRELLQNK